MNAPGEMPRTWAKNGSTPFVKRVASQMDKVESRIDILRSELLRGQQRALRKRIAQLLIAAERRGQRAGIKVFGVIMGNGTSLVTTDREQRGDCYSPLEMSQEWEICIELLNYEAGLTPFDMTIKEAHRLCKRSGVDNWEGYDDAMKQHDCSLRFTTARAETAIRTMLERGIDPKTLSDAELSKQRHVGVKTLPEIRRLLARSK